MDQQQLQHVVENERALAARLVNLNRDAQGIRGRALANSRDMTQDEQARIDSIYAEFQQTEIELGTVRAELEDARGAVSRGRVVSPADVTERRGAIHVPK